LKVLLCNDTGLVSHVGCMAVSNAHARMLGRMGHRVVRRYFLGSLVRFRCDAVAPGIEAVLKDPELAAQLADCDAVIVNGEGTMHHGLGTEYIAVLGAAQRMGKTTILANAVFQEMYGFEEVLRRLTDFTVREVRSQRFVESLGIHCRLVPDSCIEAAFSGAFIDLSGASVITDWHDQRDNDGGRACLNYMASEGTQARYFPLYFGHADILWPTVPGTLAGARVIVTGRHHGIYLAALARRPFVAMASNTFKIEGLLECFPKFGPVAPDAGAIADAASWAQRNLDVYERFFDSFMSQRPLSTFAALGGAQDPEGEQRELRMLQMDIEAQWPTDKLDLQYLIIRRSNELRMAAEMIPV
jgi:hypothetical protein